MSKHDRPGDGPTVHGQPSPRRTTRTGKLSKFFTQVFRQPSPLGVRKNDTENVLTINNEHQSVPDELKPQAQLEVDNSTQIETVVRQGDGATNANINPKIDDIECAIDHAQQHGSNMGLIPGVVNSAANTATQGNNALQSIDNINSTYLQPFRVFNTVVKELANVHPYAKIALAGLSSASQIILNQVNRDESVLKLIPKLRETYEFLIKDGELDRIRGVVDVLAPMSRQILECAQFVDKYSETKGFWTRLGKNVVSETDATIGKYNEALDALMQKFRDHAARDMVVHVHRVVEDLDRLGQDIRLDGMPYATGAGFITAKTCLDGTRLEVLNEITDWINGGNDSERTFWLSGVAGSGKSAIAHTIGRWLKEVGWLGSFVCFDRNREGDRRHEKLFSTIARDLADCNVGLRHVVAEAVSTNTSLKNTVDVVQQWQSFVLEPLSKSVMFGPIVIVIDALDESGSESSREQILQVLRDELTDLPSNVRILVTSRPLPDINEALHDKQHVRMKTMDSITAESTEQDIRLFISHRLHGLRESFDEADFIALSKKADRLFEWARLACEFIRSRARGGYSPKDRFELLITSDPEAGSLLDHIYNMILSEAIHRSPKALARFQSTMRQILATLEPLPMKSLNVMRRLFPKEEDRFGVELVIESLASLLSGVADQSIPVRPLHASFHDFLTDQSRSGEFFVDLRKNETHRVLALATLGVMKKELRFNMCALESSYLRNIDVPDLSERIKNNISPHLSYASRFWATHVHDATFDACLGEEISSFVGKEFLVFWFEALSLLGGISGSHDALESGVSPIEGRDEYSDTLAIARDAQRLIRVFGGPVSQSAPHLYLSALPLAPTKSVFASSVAPKLTRVPRVVTGRDEDWPSVQLLLKGHTAAVTSVALSPDGKWIASGSGDHTIRIWDIETGSLVGRPLRGHTYGVWSIAFFPDGQRIASGTWERTVCIWDVRTGSQIGSPLEGHQGWVHSVTISPNGKLMASGSADKTILVWDLETYSQIGCLQGHDGPVPSVAFSPDGTRIASGSYDHTVRLWDAATHQQVGDPFTGHTEPISSVAWSPNGRLIASGSYDGTIRFWNPDSGSQLGSPLRGHQGLINSVTFSFDSKHVVSGSGDRTVRVWDLASRLQIGSPLADHTSTVSSVAISRNANRIISGSSDQTVRVWDMKSTSQLGNALGGELSSIVSVTFLKDTKQVVSGSRNGTIQIWDALTGMPVGTPLNVQSTSVSAVAFLAARKWAVLALDDHSIQVWSIETRSQVGVSLRGDDASIRSVAISEDGKTIASGSGDGTIRLWSTETWLLIGEPCKGHTKWVDSVAFLPESRMVVSGSGDRTVRLWDADSGSPFGNPLAGHTGPVLSVASSPNRKYVASGARNCSVRLWDVGKGSCIGELKGHKSLVTSVAFSPTSQHIISGSDDHTIRIWDTTTLSQVGSPLVGHTSTILCVTFSPDGEWIASGSRDGIVCVWNFQSTLQLASPRDIHAAPSPSVSSPRTPLLTPDSQPPDLDDPRTPARCHIRLSPVLEHALQDPPSIIDISNWTDPVEVDSDGWVMGPNQSRILWIPAHQRGLVRFYWRSNARVPSRGHVELDLQEMAHGKTWHECWNA